MEEKLFWDGATVEWRVTNSSAGPSSSHEVRPPQDSK